MIKTVTKERVEQVDAIISTINRNEPIWKQAHKVADAFKVFGIQMVWNARKRKAYLSVGCKDACNCDGCTSTGFYVEASPFAYVRDNVTDLVIDFRLGYGYYHRNHPEQLKLLETVNNL